jgi:hypothetical protein
MRNTCEQLDNNGVEAVRTQTPEKRFEPQPVGLPTAVKRPEPPSLRMYTEEQVSQILQVSTSQLRKWRMKHNQKTQHGPPYRKIGRLVRYPEQGLLAYINGECSTH